MAQTSEPNQRHEALERVIVTSRVRRQQLEQTFEECRGQAKHWFRWSLIAAILGVLVIFGGVAMILILNITAGLVTSASSIIIEAVSALFFRQLREANKRVDNYYEKLLKEERIHQLIELALTTNIKMQNHLIEIIILHSFPIQGQEMPTPVPARQLSRNLRITHDE